MKIDATSSSDDVIDATRWLQHRVETLIEAQRFGEAIQYLRRLWLKLQDEQSRRRCTVYLGYLYLMDDDLDAAETWLARARQAEPESPHLCYAVGHVAAGNGEYARAAVEFLEAFARSDDPHDEAEFLRSAALALVRVIGPEAAVVGMLLGALDRDLGNPWILDALARVYEADQRWMETLQTLSVLAEVVENAADSMIVYRAPTARQLLRNQLMGRRARPEELRDRARAVNQAIREQFEVVLDERHRRGPTELTPLRFPTPMQRLIRELNRRDRGVELVETAQSLWARARGAQFEEILGSERLAAAIHVLVERLHWRVPTPGEELARVHGASQSAIPASARVVAGRLELELFDQSALNASLDFQLGRRLQRLGKALMFGERLEDICTEIRIGS